MNLNKSRITENVLSIFFAFLPFALVFFFLAFFWIDYKTTKFPYEQMAEQQRSIEDFRGEIDETIATKEELNKLKDDFYGMPRWYRTK